MKFLLYRAFILTLFFLSVSLIASAQHPGETTFKQVCSACHSIGDGRLVGPDLKNVTQARPEEWLIKFIKSSQTVIKSGDKYADSLFQAYNKTVMPDQASLGDAEIKNVLAFITEKSSGTGAAQASAAPGTTVTSTVVVQEPVFSPINLFLLGIIVIMLIVIWSMAKINKRLADQIGDYQSSDRSFFK
ncbi:MAG: cytochrome c [Bacteroidia bacterium]|nr:cytochrome c [Bacteroidia bacterium]